MIKTSSRAVRLQAEQILSGVSFFSLKDFSINASLILTNKCFGCGCCRGRPLCSVAHMNILKWIGKFSGSNEMISSEC